MNNLESHSPGAFFRLIHPRDEDGKVLVQRIIKGKRKESLLPMSELDKISDHAFLHDDISISTSRFVGENLLLNFIGTSALFCTIPVSVMVDDEQVIKAKLCDKGIPRPTRVLKDGKNFISIWILNRPIEKNEFHKVYLLERYLYHHLSEFSPIKSNLEIDAKIPLLCTKNTRTGRYIEESWLRGDLIDRDMLEALFCRSVNILERKNLERHSRLLQELLALFHYRSLLISARPELFKDWINFIGGSLKFFCTGNQLSRELIAVARALEGKEWKEIKDRYTKLIYDVASSSERRQSSCIDGRNYTFETWINLIHGRLEIACEEIDNCGLSFLAGQDLNTVDLKEINQNNYRFGHNNFLPIQRLLLKDVS